MLWKVLKGEQVACTPEEEAAIRAEWAANDAAAALRALEQARCSEIDQDIATQAIGAADPRTVAELKAMTKAQFFAWFDANFTTQPLLLALLKRLTLIIVRRVL